MSPRRALRPLLWVLGVVTVLALLVFRHFLLEVTVAAAVAIFLAPVQKRLTRLLRGRYALAAGVLTLGTALMIVFPIAAAATLLARQGLAFADELRPYLQPAALEAMWRQTLPERAPFLRAFIDFEGPLPELLARDAEQVLSMTRQTLQAGLAGLGGAAYELLLFVLLLFFLLRDGPRLKKELRAISPLSERRESEILSHLARTVQAVLLAMLVVPLVQGLVALPGFWFFGVPKPLLWSVFVVLAALVPLLGSPLGWVPAVAWLFLHGETWQWVGLLCWGLFGISGIDNVVKPLLLRGSADIHPLLGFLSILGGVLSFGPLGVMVGPVFLSLMLSAVRIYRLDVLREQEEAAASAAPPGGDTLVA